MLIPCPYLPSVSVLPSIPYYPTVYLLVACVPLPCWVCWCGFYTPFHSYYAFLHLYVAFPGFLHYITTLVAVPRLPLPGCYLLLPSHTRIPRYAHICDLYTFVGLPPPSTGLLLLRSCLNLYRWTTGCLLCLVQLPPSPGSPFSYTHTTTTTWLLHTGPVVVHLPAGGGSVVGLVPLVPLHHYHAVWLQITHVCNGLPHCSTHRSLWLLFIPTLPFLASYTAAVGCNHQYSIAHHHIALALRFGSGSPTYLCLPTTITLLPAVVGHYGSHLPAHLQPQLPGSSVSFFGERKAS